MKLDAIKLGTAFGIVWVLGILILAVAAYFGLWLEGYELMTRIYYGFNNYSLIGYLLGIVWAFFDAFLGVALTVYIYNKLL